MRDRRFQLGVLWHLPAQIRGLKTRAVERPDGLVQGDLPRGDRVCHRRRVSLPQRLAQQQGLDGARG